LPVAKLTWAETPGRRLSTFSRRTAQAAQLMPVLRRLDRIDAGPWGRAGALYRQHLAAL
jgi:hypothetical protein